MPLTLTGTNLIAGDERADGPARISSLDPRTGATHPPAVHEATASEVASACAAAHASVGWLARLHPGARANLLDAIAAELDAHAEALIDVAERETALGREPRLTGELARATGQLRFLGRVIREGSYLEAIIDRPPDGPDVRRVLVPIGPVAVFGASNFPLAFSVAGGDTAAALAAGCPVVVKAHPLHPHTSELVGRLVTRALRRAGVPGGVFSLTHGLDAGRDLVRDERIRAVAFTGSFAGGMALVELAGQRPVPIPVYAEMGSLNPVVVTERAAERRRDGIADGFVASMTISMGQFCTKPGVLFLPDSAAGADLRDAIAGRLRQIPGGVLLSETIRSAWATRVGEWRERDGVEVVGNGEEVIDDPVIVRPALLTTTAAEFCRTPELREECFGPATLAVSWGSLAELERAIEVLPGSLAAGIHAETDEMQSLDAVLGLLTDRAGRLIWNGWPTGVAVTWAMHHGGPFPATSNPLHTSVGATSVARFLRPVSFQAVPDPLLPSELQDANPLGIPRRIDGEMHR